MTDAEIRAIILELIGEIATDADLASARDQDDLRQVFDVDSMEFANLVITIYDRLGVNISEAHYDQLFTLMIAAVSSVRGNEKESVVRTDVALRRSHRTRATPYVVHACQRIRSCVDRQW